MRLVSVNVGYTAQRRKNKSCPVGQNNELNELLCQRSGSSCSGCICLFHHFYSCYYIYIKFGIQYDDV